MIKIRSSRAKKFGKNSSNLSTIVKIFSIFYLSILIFSYLNGSTSAYFTDPSVVTGTFQIGTWEIVEFDKKVNESNLETKKDENLHTVTDSSKKIQDHGKNENTGNNNTEIETINGNIESEKDTGIESDQDEIQIENGYTSQKKQNPDEVN